MGGITSSLINPSATSPTDIIASPIQSGDPAVMHSEKKNQSSTEAVQTANQEGSETPMIPKNKTIFGLIDPRSPTQEISRTPIAIEEQRTRREAALARLQDAREITPVTSTPNGPCAPRPATANSATPIRYSSVLKEGRQNVT